MKAIYNCSKCTAGPLIALPVKWCCVLRYIASNYLIWMCFLSGCFALQHTKNGFDEFDMKME